MRFVFFWKMVEIINLTKFKEFSDDKLNVTNMMIFIFDRVENSVGKGENAGYQNFLLFLQCFQRASSSRSFKLGWFGKGLKPHPDGSVVRVLYSSPGGFEFDTQLRRTFFLRIFACEKSSWWL